MSSQWESRRVANSAGSAVDYLDIAFGKPPQLVHNFRITNILLCCDLIETMAPVSVVLQQISPFDLDTLSSDQWSKVLWRNRVFVNPVDEAFDDPKLNESSNINIIQDWKSLVKMHLQPFLDSTRSTERGKKSTEIEFWKSRTIDVDVVWAFVLHTIFVDNKVVYLGGRSVNIAKEEKIKHQDWIVVQEMLKGNFCQIKSNICVMGDASDIFDTVDLGDDLLHREIPGIVHDFSELHLGYWDMPWFYRRGMPVNGEQLHVDCVRIVCNEITI